MWNKSRLSILYNHQLLLLSFAVILWSMTEVLSSFVSEIIPVLSLSPEHQQFALSPENRQFASSIQGYILIGLSFFFGYLIDRLTPKKVIIAASSICGISLSLVSFFFFTHSSLQPQLLICIVVTLYIGISILGLGFPVLLARNFSKTDFLVIYAIYFFLNAILASILTIPLNAILESMLNVPLNNIDSTTLSTALSSINSLLNATLFLILPCIFLLLIVIVLISDVSLFNTEKIYFRSVISQKKILFWFLIIFLTYIVVTLYSWKEFIYLVINGYYFDFSPNSLINQSLIFSLVVTFVLFALGYKRISLSLFLVFSICLIGLGASFPYPSTILVSRVIRLSGFSLFSIFSVVLIIEISPKSMQGRFLGLLQTIRLLSSTFAGLFYETTSSFLNDQTIYMQLTGLLLLCIGLICVYSVRKSPSLRVTDNNDDAERKVTP